MPTFKLTIEYEGTRYSGWQSQGNTPKTVQGKLLHAIEELFGEADLGGAGRTDAGVHASGQVAHLRLRQAVPLDPMREKINDLLPADIHVLSVERADDRFHARHDALLRSYIYQISTRRTAFGKPFVWWIKDRLDVEAMKAAASQAAGRHDFAAFTDKRAQNESTIVVVESMSVERSEDLILIRIEASHFLWKMVRKLVSALVEVGRRNMSVTAFVKLLEGNAAPYQPTAPPSGLFLEQVSYEGRSSAKETAPIVPVRTPAQAETEGGGKTLSPDQRVPKKKSSGGSSDRAGGKKSFGSFPRGPKKSWPKTKRR